jgi:DNA-directed RNA polymerase subunit RPC12/RpoP
MLSYSSRSRIYRCPQCLTRITRPDMDQNAVVCPECGNTRSVSHKCFSFVACLVVIASYVASFLVMYLLTHDLRRFMLPALECAFIILLVSARLLFLQLPLSLKPSASPKKFKRHFRHGSLAPRH